MKKAEVFLLAEVPTPLVWSLKKFNQKMQTFDPVLTRRKGGMRVLSNLILLTGFQMPVI